MALFVHEGYLGIAGADYVEIQIIGIPPSQREVQFPDVGIMSAQPILKFLFDDYLVVFGGASDYVLGPCPCYVAGSCSCDCHGGRSNNRSGYGSWKAGDSWTSRKIGNTCGPSSWLGCLCLFGGNSFWLWLCRLGGHFRRCSSDPETTVSSGDVILALIDSLFDGG